MDRDPYDLEQLSAGKCSAECSRCDCVSRPARVARCGLRGACLRGGAIGIPAALSLPNGVRSVVPGRSRRPRHPPVDEQIQEDHDEHAEDQQRLFQFVDGFADGVAVYEKYCFAGQMAGWEVQKPRLPGPWFAFI